MFAQEGTTPDGTPLVTIHAHPDATSRVLTRLSPFATLELAAEVARTMNSFYLAGRNSAPTHALWPRPLAKSAEPTESAANATSPTRCAERGSHATSGHLATCPEQLKYIDITELHLSNRAYNLLKRSGINTIGKLIKKTRDDLYDIRNLGPYLADEIEHKLASYDPPLFLSAPESFIRKTSE